MARSLSPLASLAAGAVAGAVVPSRFAAGAASLSYLAGIVAAQRGYPRVAEGLLTASFGALAPVITRSVMHPPFPIGPGASVFLWGNWRLRLQRLGPIIAEARPQYLVIHTHATDERGPTDEQIARMRGLVPGVKFIACTWVHGLEDCVPAARRVLALARRLDAYAGMVNAEAPLKGHGAAGNRAAQSLIAEWQRSTDLPLGLSAYAAPLLHRAFPWAGFCGGRDATGQYPLRVRFTLNQFYPFGDGQEGMSSAGSLERIATLARTSTARAIDLGLISEDVRHAPMVPGAFVHEREVVDLAARYPHLCVFPWSGVIDPDGARALLKASAHYAGD